MNPTMFQRKRVKNDINNVVYCLNTPNGKVICKYSLENIYDPQSTPAIDGDCVYALNQTGNMLCLNKKTADFGKAGTLSKNTKQNLHTTGFRVLRLSQEI